ncbi:MAG: ImmA/IrrE family metallo-endopeptidase [Rhodospirillales bacterium]|nr:ImmA/IrrE family metallo-endopeptidase [Rhodospirillales bacterium]
MTRVPVNPELLRWAIDRSRKDREELVARFEKLPEWESGQTRPTCKQLEAFARAVHVPAGYLFLSRPPEETVPIPDFRTLAGQAVTRPSPNLLDTLYACQERQGWYRDFARIGGQPELAFVGSARIETPPELVAASMRQTLDFGLAARRDCRSWAEALRPFVDRADAAGVLVMISGVVMNNTHRPLDPAEFRGFALADPIAPLIFVNGADTKAAQIFTLAHELAHLWLGETALSNLGAGPKPGFRREEVWCNTVAAELLVPMAALREHLQKDEPLPDTLPRLTGIFKVSTLVVLRRLLDAGWIDRAGFDSAWAAENRRLWDLAQQSGGNFYRTALSRVGRRFASALVADTLEGRTLYRDAFRMLGVSKSKTFDTLGREVGAMA